MDPNSLKAFIRLISKEKDLPPEILKEAIEHAIISSSRKQLSQYRDAVANLDIESGQLTVTVVKTVDEEVPSNHRTKIGLKEARKLLGDKHIQVGDEVRIPIDPGEFGRIAAQSARQMVMQRLRDAERDKIFAEFKDREGQMITGIVQRFERRDVILNIGRAEGVLPMSEQPHGAQYHFNDRLRVLIMKVENTTKGPVIILSRKTPQLVIELFRNEVPEIADGTVQIVGVAREAGVRTKIAVKSVNSDVDPVGACVGMKGSRVQMVVRELENEKIDIVPWSYDSSTFIRNALNPAKIVSIDLNEEDKRASVMVAQGNLAIAIGRKGQNTKLAARLTGYRLDIRSENEEELAYEEIQRRYLEDFLSQVEGLSDWLQEAILRSNFNSVEKIAHAETEKLLPFTGGDEQLCESLIQGAGEYLIALREMEQERRLNRTEEEEEETASDETAAEPETGQEEHPEAASATPEATDVDVETAPEAAAESVEPIEDEIPIEQATDEVGEAEPGERIGPALEEPESEPEQQGQPEPEEEPRTNE